MSDQQHSQSQSDFNNLNKLNPDQDQSQSQSSVPHLMQPHPPIPSTSPPTRAPTTTNHPIIAKPQPIRKQLTLVKQTKPRLIIDHMILKNFKSYAGTQKIGPFHKNFTSIVGPNGSGKSNLIESMLFIFGFNASWMRLNKLHQLIHNSSQLNNVGSAAVEVHFKKILDHADGSISEIPDSQFFIRRTVNMASVSKYYLNGNDSTQAEVKAKLKSEGIDLTNNRFLILQGEVEQISQMRQKSGDRDKPGFLEYLEDIIGSNQFIERIEDAVKQYNENEETKHEKGERMKIVENELKSMTSQKQQAIKYVKKQRKIFQVESILQQVLRSNSAYELKKVQSRVQELQRRKDQIIKEEKEKMSRQAERVREIKRLREENEKIEKEVVRDNQKMTELSTEDKNLKGQIAYSAEDQVKWEKKIEEINIEFTKIVEESETIRKHLPQKQKALAEQKSQLDQLKQHLSKHDRPQLRQRIKHIQNQLKKTILQKTTFQDKHKTLSQQVTKHSQANHQHKISEYKQQLHHNLQTKAKIEIAMQKATQQFKQTKQQHDQQVSARNRLRQQADVTEHMIRQKNSQKFQQGQMNNMYNHIMKAQIPGVIGRLGDLGDVPRQLEEVVCTACVRLDNIVTETYEAASRVLELLKRNKLGRTTCIILEKITEFKDYMNKPYKTPQGAIRLFDVIKPSSQQARIAFYFALSNTLYSQNLDHALKLALGDDQNRRRVIARKSKGGFTIYEMNGIINSVYARRGGFQKKAAQQKKRNQGEDREVEQRHQAVVRQLEEKNERVREIERRLKEVEDHLQAMRSEKVIEEGKIRDVTDQLKDLEKMVERSKGKKQAVDNMQKEMKALEKEIQKMEGEIEGLQQKLADVENEQKSLQTSQVTEMRQRYKSLRQEYTKLQKQVQKQQVLITTVQKRIKQNQQRKLHTQKTITQLQDRIEKCKKDMSHVQHLGLQLLTNIETNRRRQAEIRNKEDEIKKILDQDQQAVRESRQKIEQAKLHVDNARREIRKADEDFKFASSQLDRVRKLYREMTSTYDFIGDIDQIELMNIENTGVNQGSSMLDITIRNTSLDVTMITEQRNGTSTSGKKNNDPRAMIDLKKLQKLDPHQDLTQQQLDQFLLFEQKLRSILNIDGTQLKKMQGKNLQVISEYKLKFTDYKQKLKEFNEVKERQMVLKRTINELKEQRFQMFREGFAVINSKLKEVYQLLTSGGDAELELIDSLDPFSDGVNFSVRPPKKAWKQINKLSGGQKTLSSLSLIFALHYYKPTPLYFMDEIDAALDFKNVSIVGDYIKKRTKDAQFIIISLRNNMFDLADKLVGVYKTFDQTKVINLAAGRLGMKRQLGSTQQEKKGDNDMGDQLERVVGM